MEETREVFDRIDQYRDEVIRLQGELTSRVALGPKNGGSGEHDKASLIRSYMESMGPDVLEEIKAPDENARDNYRPNLLARWGGKKTRQTVWVLSHSDIVPPGDLSLWESNPYEIRVDGDRIIGRGVEDNQHGFVSSYLALKAILDSGRTPARAVGLAVVADEETGSDYGLNYVLGHHRQFFDPGDLIIVPDGGNEEGTMIEVAEKSLFWLRFVVLGRQCHASTPQKGKNSLLGVAKLIVALQELKTRWDLSDELFRPPVSTFEPTKIEANVPNINTIPGKDVFHLDCRVLPRYKLDEVYAACEEIAARIAEELSLKIEIEQVYRQDATEPTPPDAPVVKALAEAVLKVTGKKARPMGIGGGTVAAFFRRAGLPAAVWSTVSDTAHQPNEYCSISNIVSDAKVFACLYLGLESG